MNTEMNQDMNKVDESAIHHCGSQQVSSEIKESGRNELGYAHSLENTADAVGVDAEALNTKISDIALAWYKGDGTTSSMLVEMLEKRLNKRELSVLAAESVVEKIKGIIASNPIAALMAVLGKDSDD